MKLFSKKSSEEFFISSANKSNCVAAKEVILKRKHVRSGPTLNEEDRLGLRRCLREWRKKKKKQLSCKKWLKRRRERKEQKIFWLESFLVTF